MKNTNKSTEYSYSDNFQLMRNSEQFEMLKSFYSDNSINCMLVNGMGGTYKTGLVEHSLLTLPEDFLVFRFKFFEATTVEDIFLSFFNDLKFYHQTGKINIYKIETHSLIQKISNYLSHLNLPAVIIFDSLENIYSDKKNSDEIFSFIEHLNAINKFKIVLIARYFNNSELNLKNSTVISLNPYTREEVHDYFLSQSIADSQEFLDDLYKITKGNASYINITANIIKTLNISLKNLVEEFSRKKITYEDFIIQKLVSFVPDKYRKSMQILTMINSGLYEDFLLHQNLFPKEQLNYLIDKDVISKECNYLFLKNEVKNYLIHYISHFEKIKIHQFLKSFYETQLPLKPGSRMIPISRNTMRAQIEFHSAALPDILPEKNENLNTSLLNYLNINIPEWNTETKVTVEEIKPKKTKKNGTTQKNELESKYQLTKEELALLGVPCDLNKTADSDIKTSEVIVEPNFTIEELLEQANKFEENHEYKQALIKCLVAYDKKDDIRYEQSLPVVLERLAVLSKKNNNSDDTAMYYKKLADYYDLSGENQKANSILLKVADLYRSVFKYNHAKEIYINFIKNKNINDDILASSYIALAEIEEESSNLEDAINYYRKAFEMASFVSDKTFLAEAYFKYALILDDNSDTDTALLYYNKCTEAASESISDNTFLSSAYTNIAEIYREKNNIPESIKCFHSALKVDAALHNYDGIYYLCTRLADIYRITDSTKALDYYLKALSAAKRIKDNVYITESYKRIGDYYYSIKNLKQSLKAYLFAQKFAEQIDFNSDIILKIKHSIEKIKNNLRPDMFELVVKGFDINAK